MIYGHNNKYVIKLQLSIAIGLNNIFLQYHFLYIEKLKIKF